MTSDQRQLRPSLFPGLLRAAQRNVARGRGNVRIFEIGKIFSGWGTEAELPDEAEHVGMILVGSMTAHWSEDDRPADAFDMKGILHLALGEIGIDGWSLEPDAGMPFHPGRSAWIVLNGQRVGVLGEVRPSVARAFDLDGAVLGGLTLAPLFAAAPTELRVRDLPTQPPVLRHVSMWLPGDAAAADVIATIEAAGGDYLERVEVIDEYREPGGRRSVAFGLTFRAPDRTLTADEADTAREAIAGACRERHGAEIR